MKRIIALIIFSFIFLGCSSLNEDESWQPGMEIEIVESTIYFLEEDNLVSFNVKVKNNSNKEIEYHVQFEIKNQLLNELIGVDSFYIGEDVLGTKENFIIESHSLKTVGKTINLEINKDDLKKIIDEENGIKVKVYFEGQVISTNPSYHYVK